MTDLHNEANVASTSVDTATPLPGWRYLYYAVCLLFGAGWGILVTGLLWLGNFKDPVMKKVHRLAFMLAVVSTLLLVAIVVTVSSAASHAMNAAGSNGSASQLSDVPSPEPIHSYGSEAYPKENLTDSPSTIVNNMWMVVRESVCSTPHPEGIDYKFSKSDTYNGTSDGLSASLHQIITSGKHYCALNYLSNVSVVVGTGIDPVTGSSAPAQTITWDDSENADGKITKFHYSMTYIWSATKWLEVKTTQK